MAYTSVGTCESGIVGSINFAYGMYGVATGKLSIVTTAPDGSETEAWSREGQQGEVC